MKIAIGSDHRGFEYKSKIIEFLRKNSHEVLDCGPFSDDKCDYPDFGKAVGENVANKNVDFGIVVCSSGEGIMMAANKIKGVRCGIGYNDEVSKYMRLHNDANVISFGADYMNLDDVLNRITLFLSTEFEGGRHCNRVKKICDLEK